MFRHQHQSHQTRDFAELLGVFVQAEGHGQKSVELARGRGLLVRKGDVGGSTAADLGGIGDLLGDSFFVSLEHGGGVFDTISERGRRAQLRARAFIADGPIVAQVVGEGFSIPLARFTLDAIGLVPQKVGALVVASVESMSTVEGAESVAAEMRESITLGIDTAFLGQLAQDAGFSDVLSGDPLVDIKMMIDAVSLSGRGDLVLVMSPTLANFYSTAQALGLPVFPDLSPVGGTVCNIETLVSAGCPGLMLVDVQSILTGAQAIEFKYSTAASIEMADNPAANSGAPTAPTGRVVNLFTVDAVGVIALRSFAAKSIRQSGIALLLPAPETT